MSLYPDVSLCFPEAADPNWPICQYSDEEVEYLLSVGLMTPSRNQSRAGYFSSLFAVNEVNKNRRRMVQDTLSANILCAEPSHVQFTSIGLLRRAVFKGTHGATFDVKAMFYHFGLSPDVAERAFRVLTRDGTIMDFGRLPMGFKWAVKIAQTAIKFLTAGLPEVHIELYIDNVLIIGSREAVQRARPYSYLAVPRTVSSSGRTLGYKRL